MSYSTWSVEGFGICTSEIKTTKEKLINLINMSPKLNGEINKWLMDNDNYNPTLEDYLEFDDDYCSGIAYLMQRVIKDVENINMDIADSFDGDWYLLITPWYPWSTGITPEENNLTRKSAEYIFNKYVSILTDQKIDIDYQSVENGG